MPSVSDHDIRHVDWFNNLQADFGIIMPRLSLLATIAFAYSILSPLINVMALISKPFSSNMTEMVDQA